MGGFVSVGSDIQLRELQYFRVRALEARPDIRIRVAPVGEPGLRARSLVTHGPSFVTYEEHLGQLGGNFRLDFEVTASTWRWRRCSGGSPHVVYTNVVEALLRFVLVSRGCLLLHSATVELDGHGSCSRLKTVTAPSTTRPARARGRLPGRDLVLGAAWTAPSYPALTISAQAFSVVADAHEAARPSPADSRDKGGPRIGPAGDLNQPSWP